MKTWSTLLFAATLACNALAQTLYLVGDSTMTDWADSSGQEGWGAPAITQPYFNIPVVNRAVSGRSIRSYRREGKWAAVVALLKAGDFVVVEFGHNDGGSPSTSDRASVVGEGTNTETVTLADGTKEVVQTWTTYAKWYIDEAKAKGATIIMSSQTPNNPYENVSTISPYSPPRFVAYAKNVAATKGVPFVNHFYATYQLFAKLGKAKVDSYFNIDHTHTSPAGAAQVAWAFLSAIQCPKGTLYSHVTSAGSGAGPRCE